MFRVGNPRMPIHMGSDGSRECRKVPARKSATLRKINSSVERAPRCDFSHTRHRTNDNSRSPSTKCTKWAGGVFVEKNARRADEETRSKKQKEVSSLPVKKRKTPADVTRRG
jgi:hypothetical protein